ncbi:MAG: multi-sensor signal transduction histidine kinase [Rickettsiaceae bacterium]|jgi:light-regulated signal transduction histidine kinase (bacteriophytochrome)|nr:multi-sensor signal transduction histidine kinase [Rickettsiaceae bacterium]
MTQECETKLKNLSADLELMAHITSHDLRDPLRQAIINCSELEKVINDTSSAKLLEDTKESINDVLARIALLREYSYMANFNQELKPVNCNAIIQKSLEALSAKTAEAKITCSTLPTVNAYEPHLMKLFTHLIDNALKFKSEEPVKISISCEESDDCWQFCIADNGIGIDHVYRHLVFALFQRLDPEIKDGSFGAGLAFAKKIVENNHGEIWFELNQPNGTKFYFTLPK